MRAILDTSVLIDQIEPAPQDQAAISAITLAELWYGVFTASDHDRPQRLRRMMAIERRFDALPVDEAVAQSYGELTAAVRRAGRKVTGRKFDLLIAATAHAHQAGLYTRNPADFKGLEALVDVIPV